MSFSVGAFSKLSMNGKIIDFKAIDPADSADHLVDPSKDRITGSRIPQGDNVSPGLVSRRHHILTEPTAEEFAVLLPLMGIPVSSGNTYILGETVPSFPMIIDRVAKVMTYSASYVDKWILRGQKGLKPWALELQVVSLAETRGAAGSFSSTALATKTGPYPFSKGTLTLDGTEFKFDQFALAGDNHVLLRYNNAETADDAMSTGSDIILATSIPYSTSSEIALFDDGTAATRSDGFDGALAFTLGNVSTTFAFGNMKAPNQLPKISSKFDEIRLPRYFSVYEQNSNDQLTVVHDSDPSA